MSSGQFPDPSFALTWFSFDRVEEELRFLSDTTDGDSASKRTLARRSFFRRKKHQRSSSRDSKDLSSFSSTQLSWFSDSGILGEDGTLASYQRVERLNCRSHHDPPLPQIRLILYFTLLCQTLYADQCWFLAHWLTVLLRNWRLIFLNCFNVAWQRQWTVHKKRWRKGCRVTFSSTIVVVAVFMNAQLCRRFESLATR